MKRILISCLAILVSFGLFAQDIEKTKIQVLDSNLEVNSFTSVGGYTRNYAIVDLPENCYAVVYKITISRTKKPTEARTLLAELSTMIPDARVQTFGQLSELIAEVTVNEKVDVFIMNNFTDLSNFYEKNDFKYCQGLSGTNNNCYIATPCESRRLYFGLRNNNWTTGFIVNLQVVALYIRALQKSSNGANTNDGIITKKDLIGNWRDDNSTLAFSETGEITIKWYSGETASGTWSLTGPTLNLDFSKNSANYYKENDFYQIQSYNGHTFKYKSLKSQTIYTATRRPY